MKLNVNTIQRFWQLGVTTAPSSRTTPWMNFLVMRGSNINIPLLIPLKKWCCGEEESHSNRCCKKHDGGVQKSIKLLGGGHQHRLSCNQLSLSPQDIEQDS